MSWRKSWLAQPFSSLFSDSEVTLHQIAMNRVINRRRSTRILYPPLGPLGSLPQVFLQDELMQAVDISLGGVCLIDAENRLGAGEEINLQMVWSDFSCSQKATVIGVNLDRRHIQFEHIHPGFLVRLNVLLKPGFIGTRLHKVSIATSSVPISAAELWLGPTGENLVFYQETAEPDLVADIFLERLPIRIFRHSVPVFRERLGRIKAGQRVLKEHVQNIIICLANIKNPSPRILDLMRILPQWLSELEGGASHDNS